MIIDTHVHIGIFEDVDRVVNMSQEIVLESMQLYNIDFALVSNAAVEYDCQWQPVPMEKQKSQEEYFREAIAFARANEGRIGVLPWVKPANETVTEELEELIRENRDVVYGIKVHPFHSKIAFDSPQVEAYVKLAQKYQLPIITHTADCDEACSERVYNMALKYPDVDFVYPMHLNPNVRKPIHEVFGEDLSDLGNMFFIEPLEYLSFVYLMEKSTIVLTDSGEQLKTYK